MNLIPVCVCVLVIDLIFKDLDMWWRLKLYQWVQTFLKRLKMHYN